MIPVSPAGSITVAMTTEVNRLVDARETAIMAVTATAAAEVRVVAVVTATAVVAVRVVTAVTATAVADITATAEAVSLRPASCT